MALEKVTSGKFITNFLRENHDSQEFNKFSIKLFPEVLKRFSISKKRIRHLVKVKEWGDDYILLELKPPGTIQPYSILESFLSFYTSLNKKDFEEVKDIITDKLISSTFNGF